VLVLGVSADSVGQHLEPCFAHRIPLIAWARHAPPRHRRRRPPASIPSPWAVALGTTPRARSSTSSVNERAGLRVSPCCASATDSPPRLTASASCSSPSSASGLRARLRAEPHRGPSGAANHPHQAHAAATARERNHAKAVLCSGGRCHAKGALPGSRSATAAMVRRRRLACRGGGSGGLSRRPALREYARGERPARAVR